MGRRRVKQQRKPRILKPQKTKEFKNQKRVHEEDQKPSSSPSSPPQPSSPLATQNAQNLEHDQKPCIDLMLSSHSPDDFDPKNVSVALPIISMPPSPKTPSHLAIVPYKDPSLKAYTHSTWKKKRDLMNYHWNKKKLETLTDNFNPIPFSTRKRPSNMAVHQHLLTRLGLWDFLHAGFAQNIRTDLIAELIICYNPKRSPYCRSRVKGRAINLTCAALARALHLPVKSHNVIAKGECKEGFFMVSEEEALFLEELVWGWMVLQDDGCKVPDEVLKFTRFIRERKVGEVDWAGLIWFMVERELLKGKNLVNCYYASHMQLLLKYEKPNLFVDDFENMDSSDIGATMADVKMLELEDAEKDNKLIVLFDEKLEKESRFGEEKSSVGMEESENEQKNENIIVKCYKRRSEYMEKFMGKRNLCREDNQGNNITMPGSEGEELQKQRESVELLAPNFGVVQQIKAVTQDQHLPELQGKDEEENKRGKLDELVCDEMGYQQGGSNCMGDSNGKDLESNGSIDMMIIQDTQEEGVKIEGSTDLTLGGMDDLNGQVKGNQQIDLVSSQKIGETGFSLEVSMAEDEHMIGEKINLSDEHLATEMQYDIIETRLVQGEKEADVMDWLAKEVFEAEICELLDNREKELPNVQVDLSAGKHYIDHENDLKGGNQEGPHFYDFFKKGEENVEQKASDLNEIVEPKIGELLDNRYKELPNVEADLSEEKRNSKHENALKEGGSQERRHISDSLRKGEHNIEPEASDFNEFLGAETDKMEATCCAVQDKDGSDHVTGTKREDVIVLEYEEGQLNRSNNSEGFASQQCTPSSGEEPEVHKENIQVGKTDCHSLELHCEDEKEKKRGNLNDLECNKMDYLQGDSHCRRDSNEKDRDGSINMLIIQDTHEEGVKIEGSTDLAFCGMDNLNRQEKEHQLTDLVSSQGNGEADVRLEVSMEEDRHAIVEKITVSDKHLVTEMEHDNIELRFVHAEKEAQVMDGLSKEVSEAEIGELLHSSEKELPNIQVDLSAEKLNGDHENVLEEGNQERVYICDSSKKGEENVVPEGSNFSEFLGAETDNMQVDLNAEKRNSDYANALTEGEAQEGLHICDSLKKGEENVEPEAIYFNEFLGAETDNMQVTMNAVRHKDGRDHVTDTKGDDVLVLEYEEKDKGKCQLNRSNNSEGFALQHCAPHSGEEPEVDKENLQVGETDCYYLPRECPPIEDLYCARGVQSPGTKEVLLDLPNFNVHQSFMEPFVSRNMHKETLIPFVHEKSLENKINKKVGFMENCVSGIHMNLAGSSIDNSLRRGMVCQNDGYREHVIETQKRTESNIACDDELLDLELCTEQVEISVARLLNAARKLSQSDHEIKGRMLKQLEEQNKIIQQYKRMKLEEEQRKQKVIYRYERELHLMHSVVLDYRKALKEVHKSFAKYRECYQLPEESLYRDHPDGRGEVILAAELKTLEQEGQNKAARIKIESMVKNFQDECFRKLEGHLLKFDLLCDRLEDSEIAITLLKEKFLKPQEFKT